ncbi:MAG: YdcF family protein [Acidobacteriia bacterium]|nr:YdcF family protein [Terriglobia bacterium]
MKRALRILALILAAVVVLGLIFHEAVLAGLGSYLVNAEAPQKADIALVLAGDGEGNRILAAAQLARRGYVSKVLVSGPSGLYGYHECDLEIPFAVKAGYPESYFLHFENDAKSTQEEALEAIPRLHQLNAHKVLLVTSDYHTRRAGRIYRSAAPDLQFIVVAAPDSSFTAGGWWHNRQGKKIAFIEWVKTVTEWFGI